MSFAPLEFGRTFALGVGELYLPGDQSKALWVAGGAALKVQRALELGELGIRTQGIVIGTAGLWLDLPEPGLDQDGILAAREILPQADGQFCGTPSRPWGHGYFANLHAVVVEVGGLGPDNGATITRKFAVEEIDLSLTDQTALIVPDDVGAHNVRVLGVVTEVITGSGGITSFSVGTLDGNPEAWAVAVPLALATSFRAGRGGAQGDGGAYYDEKGLTVQLFPEPPGETFTAGKVEITVFWDEQTAPS